MTQQPAGLVPLSDGRVTHQEMSGVWPTSTADDAKPTNEIPKVVFSRTLTITHYPDGTDISIYRRPS